MELMLTIDPPPVFAICSAASFVPRNTLVWLTAMMRCQRRNAIPALHCSEVASAKSAAGGWQRMKIRRASERACARSQ
jgi:hypothetical protein